MDIKYSDVSNAFLTQLINMCANITRFGNIDACYKTGYRQTVYPAHTHNVPTGGQTPTYVPSCTYYISGNVITQQYSQNLTNDFNAFIARLGLNMSETCTVNGMFYLLENLTEFALKNICYATSFLTTNKWIIYLPTNNEVVITHDFSELMDNYARKEITLEIISHYMANIKNNLRAYPAIYKYVCNN